MALKRLEHNGRHPQFPGSKTDQQEDPLKDKLTLFSRPDGSKVTQFFLDHEDEINTLLAVVPGNGSKTRIVLSNGNHSWTLTKDNTTGVMTIKVSGSDLIIFKPSQKGDTVPAFI